MVNSYQSRRDNAHQNSIDMDSSPPSQPLVSWCRGIHSKRPMSRGPTPSAAPRRRKTARPEGGELSLDLVVLALLGILVLVLAIPLISELTRNEPARHDYRFIPR